MYVEPEEAFANLIVFKETNKLFADKTGLWADAPARDFADYVLFVTPDRGKPTSPFTTPRCARLRAASSRVLTTAWHRS